MIIGASTSLSLDPVHSLNRALHRKMHPHLFWNPYVPITHPKGGLYQTTDPIPGTPDYDAATSSPTPDAPPDFHTSIFPTADPAIPKAAAELVKRLREKHYYTDTQNFDLRCQVGPSDLITPRRSRALADSSFAGWG